jgi:hypothetical protein
VTEAKVAPPPDPRRVGNHTHLHRGRQPNSPTVMTVESSISGGRTRVIKRVRSVALVEMDGGPKARREFHVSDC